MELDPKIKILVPIEYLTLEQVLDRYGNNLSEEEIKQLKCLSQSKPK
jgi:hypothetical protein